MTPAVLDPDKSLTTRRYTPQQRKQGFEAIVLSGGNCRRAERLLGATTGKAISHGTLAQWKRKYPEDYHAVSKELEPRMAEEMARKQDELIFEAGELEGEAVAILRQRLKQGDVETKDAANIAHKAAIQGGIHIDKAQLLRSKPTQIVQQSPDEVLRKLTAAVKGQKPKQVENIEGSAEEIESPPA